MMAERSPGRVSRSALKSVAPEQFAINHPFIQWYSSYWSRGSGRSVMKTSNNEGDTGDETITCDLIMGEMASSRFSIGVDDDNIPVLGLAEGDSDSVMSMPWSKVAFIRRIMGMDWVALASNDARIDKAGSDVPTLMRLWLPANFGVLDGWNTGFKRPVSIKLIEVAIRHGRPVSKDVAPLAILPLSFRGDWVPEDADTGKSKTALVVA